MAIDTRELLPAHTPLQQGPNRCGCETRSEAQRVDEQACNSTSPRIQ